MRRFSIVKNFPIENIPSLRSFIRRGIKMAKKTLPYKGFAIDTAAFASKKKLYSREQIDNVVTMLENLPDKNKNV